jgi:hypothetical protein
MGAMALAATLGYVPTASAVDVVIMVCQPDATKPVARVIVVACSQHDGSSVCPSSAGASCSRTLARALSRTGAELEGVTNPGPQLEVVYTIRTPSSGRR